MSSARKEKLLKKLGISPSEIQNLTNDELYKIVKKQWLKLSVRLHPDKNRNDPTAGGKFRDLSEAFKKLEKLLRNGDNNNAYKPEIENYFKQEKIDIPETAFNLALIENIEMAYKELLKAFLILEDNEEKRGFANHYAPFLNLAGSLAEIAQNLHRKRFDYYMDRQHETFLACSTLEWRELIIRLYGEEYLDDFRYRHTLSHGGLYLILAWRKLLSPVKLVVAIIETILLLIKNAVYYLTKPIFKNFTESASRIRSNYLDGKAHAYDVFLFLLKTLALTAIINLVPTALLLLVLAIPLAVKLLDLIGSPVNNIVRPISRYVGVSPVVLSVLAAGLCVAGLLGGYFALSAISLAVTTMLPHLLDFLILGYLTLPAALIMHNIINSWQKQTRILEQLPLPQTSVPESIKSATLIGNKRAAQSHYFFRTPKEAKYIEPHEQTCSQQCSSFFGGGIVNKSAKPWCSVGAKTIPLLSYRPA